MGDDESVPVVERVLDSLQQYLYDNLPLNVDFIIQLQTAGLIEKDTSAKLCALAHSGDRSCIRDLITYMQNFWVEATLDKFCTFLNKYGKQARPRMVEVAAKIREKLKGEVNEPGPSGSNRSQLPSDGQYPQSKRPYSTTKEDKPLSQNKKVQAIVRRFYKKELFMPRNEDLEIEFAYIMGDLNVALDPHTISREERLRIQGTVGAMYTNITERIVPPPFSDPDCDNLFAFIDEHSNFCEPFLVDIAIKVLNEHEELKKRFTKYKEDLKAWLDIRIANFPRTAIVLPDLSSESCLAMCTSASEDHVLLAYIIEMQGYLKHFLQLDCSRLLGMQIGCTIVYFSISAVDANLLRPRILSHLAELKEKFSLSYIVLIDHFVVDVESGDFEVLQLSASMIQPREDFHIETEEPNGIVEALALQLSETNLELHQTPDQLDDVDVQAESDLLKDELEPQELGRPLSETSDRQKAEWFSNYSEALQKAVDEQDFQEDSDPRKFVKSLVRKPESKKYACCIFDSRGVTDFRSYVENVVYIVVSKGKAPYGKRFFKVTDYEKEEQVAPKMITEWFEKIKKENGKVNEVRLETHGPEVLSASDTAILMINAFGKENLSHKGNANPQLKNVQRRSTSQEIPEALQDKLGALFLHQSWQACEQGRMIELLYDIDETSVTAQETPIPDKPWPRVQDPTDNP